VRDLLVTGTDTGIGKTVVSAALIKALRAYGVSALGFKPVETGVVAGELADSDELARASGEKHALASPLLQLPEALAPAVAAARAGMDVNPAEIEARITSLRAAGHTLIIEGAGGVMVPLSWAQKHALGSDPRTVRGSDPSDGDGAFFTVLDLAERCSLEAIVVGRAGLGTLNHVALTVAMLNTRGIPVRAVVLNGRRSPDDLAELTNPSTLARMLPGLPIVEIPHHTRGKPIDATTPYLATLAADLIATPPL